MNALHQLKTAAKPLVLALGAVGVAGMVMTLSGCSEATGKAAEAQAPSAGPPVSVAPVLEKTVSETQEFSGRLEAIERVELRPRVSGYITAVNFTPGAEVKKGDVLFVIDPRPYQAEADRADANARSARAKADLARIELTRAERLLGDKAIAQREYDERAAGLKQLDADARAAAAQAESARLNVAYTRVTSPIAGRVSKAEITLGNLVDGASVLTTVVSLDRIYASFDGDEATYLRVAASAHGAKSAASLPEVHVGLANEEGYPHAGRLEFVDNQLDNRTGSVRMRAVFANADHVMAPGLFARVQIGAGEAHKALLVVDKAISTDQDRKYVFVVGADGKAEYRALKLGPIVDGLRVVREGLKPGEKIVVSGLQRVRPGAPVTAQPVAMDPKVAMLDAGAAAKAKE